MNPKVEYASAHGVTMVELVQGVNQMLSQGWEPFGSIVKGRAISTPGATPVDCFIQALTRPAPSVTGKPRVVCLCGSVRFVEAFKAATLRETMAGRIVLSVASMADASPAEMTEEVKRRVDQLHFRKIDLADEILVLNVNGYVGASTQSEIDYATRTGKPVRWLEGRAS